MTPETQAGRALFDELRLRAGTPNDRLLLEQILATEREAFWNGVKSVEEVHNPSDSKAVPA